MESRVPGGMCMSRRLGRRRGSSRVGVWFGDSDANCGGRTGGCYIKRDPVGANALTVHRRCVVVLVGFISLFTSRDEFLLRVSHLIATLLPRFDDGSWLNRGTCNGSSLLARYEVRSYRQTREGGFGETSKTATLQHLLAYV